MSNLYEACTVLKLATEIVGKSSNVFINCNIGKGLNKMFIIEACSFKPVTIHDVHKLFKDMNEYLSSMNTNSVLESIYDVDGHNTYTVEWKR